MSLLIGSARVAIVPDVSDFGADLKAKLTAELRSIGRPTIPVSFDIDAASLAKVRSAAASTPPVKIGVDADLNEGSVAAAAAKLKSLSGNFFTGALLGPSQDYWRTAASNWFRTGEDAFAAAAASSNNSGGGNGGLLGALLGYRAIKGGRFGFLGTKIAGIRAWHLALDAAVEALISVGTAAAAAAVGIGVLYPTLDGIRDHIVAVSNVNAALGYQIPGLQAKFDSLAHAMAPQGIELYGAAMRLVTGQTGVFGGVARTVITDFDTWAAKIDLWANHQGTFSSLLHTGISYLTQFAHVGGEVGIALGNILRKDPGIARFLLDILSGAGKLLDLFTSLPGPIVESTLAIHGMWIWGRVLGGALLSAARGAYNFGTAMIPLAANPLFWVAAAAAGLGYLAYEGGHASSSISRLTSSMDAALASASASQAILEITHDLGALNSQIRSVNSEGALRLFGNQSTVTQASLAVRSALDNIGAGVRDLANGNPIGFLSSEWKAFSTVVLGNTGPAAALAESNALKALDGEINNLLGHQRNLFQETGALIRQGYTYGQSLALMDLAGVRAGDSFDVMRQKVANLISGYQSMSIRGGLLANSVNAITFATDQQDSKVTQLTSAWSTFFSTLSGGESGFTSFVQAMGGSLTTRLRNGASSTTTYQGLAQALATAQGNITGLGAASISARSQFITAAQAAQTEMNNLTLLASAAGLGQRGTNLLTQASRDMVSSMLPAARASSALTTILYGLAQQGGYKGADSFKALTQWAGNAKDPLKNLDGVVTTLTVAAGNLANDVKNLSTALGTTLTQAMSQAIFYANGGQKAFDNYAMALHNSGPNSVAAQNAAEKLAEELISVTGNTKTAQREFETMTIGMGYTKQQADLLWASVSALAGTLDKIRKIGQIKLSIDVLESVGISGNPAAVKIAEAAGLNNSFISHARFYASGTSSAAPGWAWVGEQGPEMVLMRGGETVVPSEDIGAYAAGAGFMGLAGALGSGGASPHDSTLGGAPAGGDTYNAYFDGWTGAALEARVRNAFQSMSVAHGKRLRVGRNS